MTDKSNELKIFKFYLLKEGFSILRLTGNSMHPTLMDNWKVKVKPVETKEITSGDIIVFDQNELICHRIIGKLNWNKKLYFIHRGDSQKAGKIFEEKDLVGKVVEVFDTDDKRIDEKIWHKSFDSISKFKLLGYIYFILFLTKRAFFGKRQNRLTRWTRRFFWRVCYFTY